LSTDGSNGNHNSEPTEIMNVFLTNKLQKKPVLVKYYQF